MITSSPYGCGCSVVELSSPDPILALASMDTHLLSSHQGIRDKSAQWYKKCPDSTVLWTNVSPQIPGLYHIQCINCIKMANHVK